MNNLMNTGNLTVRDNTLSKRDVDIYTGSLTRNTRRAYIKDVKQFFGVEDLTAIPLDKIVSVTPSDASQYREWLMSEGNNGKPYAPSTVNRKLTSLSKFYSVLCWRSVGIMEYNPFSTKQGTARLKNPDKKYSNTRCLTKDEVKRLIEATKRDNTLLSMRNLIIILLLATTGMRREEIVDIKISDVTVNKGKHVVEILGKGRKSRFIVIANSIKVFIDNYIQLRGLSYKDKDKYLLGRHTSNSDWYDNSPLTPQTVYNVVKAIAKRANMDYKTISPHCFRHTYVTEALNLGKPIQDVQDMVGHSDVNTTKRYSHTDRVITNNPADEMAGMYL